MAVGHFGCILLGICWASWMCRLLFIIKFWDFFQPFYWIHFLFPFSFSSQYGHPILHMSVLLMMSHISLRHCSFSSILLSVIWIVYQPTFEVINYFFCQFKSTIESLYWFFHLLYFQFKNFHLVHVYNFYPFIIILWWHCHTFLFKAWFFFFSFLNTL